MAARITGELRRGPVRGPARLLREDLLRLPPYFFTPCRFVLRQPGPHPGRDLAGSDEWERRTSLDRNIILPLPHKDHQRAIGVAPQFGNANVAVDQSALTEAP